MEKAFEMEKNYKLNRPEWNTKELQEDFEVISFSYGMVSVVRKFDGQKGFMDFNHSPRVYFNFIATDQIEEKMKCRKELN